jgi:hypothetical protein
MRRYKMIARILLILPIINFAFAIPVAVQETRQVDDDGVHDVAITMSAKRDNEMERLWDMYFDRLSSKPESAGAASRPPSGSAQSVSDPGRDTKMAKLWDTYFERLSGKPDSSSAAHPSLDPAQSESESNHGSMNGDAPLQNPTSSTAPDHGSMDPPQTDKSDIQQVSPELPKSPSLSHYLESPESDEHLSSLDEYLASLESDTPFSSMNDYLASTALKSGSSTSAVSGSGQSTLSSSIGKPESKSFLSNVVSKLKFWRRISGPGSVRDAVNTTRRELQGLVNTGAYVSASSPESQTF